MNRARLAGCKNGGVRAAVLAAMVVALLSLTTGTKAQAPYQATGLTVEQHHGFATLAWDPVAGATDYEIERTAVDSSDQPIGPSLIVGLWRPERQVHQESPTFADAGFLPGGRFQWRVRARFDGNPQPYSEPTIATTLSQWGDPQIAGENLRTSWEQYQAALFTTDQDEYAYTAALDEMSDRVRVVQIGSTVEGRPINMFIIGYPSPPATPEAVASVPSVLINCGTHGNEPSGREACLIMTRELAFANDPRTLDILSNLIVLIVPAINGDGRAANTRTNANLTDLNRDFATLTQPETFAFVRMLRDHRPQAGFDSHEEGVDESGDLPMLPPRHLNVAQSIFDESQRMLVGWMYEQGSVDGWWPSPYDGLSNEGTLRNNMGLKNMVGALLDGRRPPGPTRPGEEGDVENRRRRTYSHLWTFHEFLDYARSNQRAVARAREQAIEYQISNSGPIVFRGSYPIPAFPAPHPGQVPPSEEDPSADEILLNPPCGYLLSEEQYNGVRVDGATTLAQRMEAHGWIVERRHSGYLVPMAQPQRGMIPLLLDGHAVNPWVASTRMYPAPGQPPGKSLPAVACVVAAS